MNIRGSIFGQSAVTGRNITVRTTGDETKAGGGGTTLSDVRDFLQKEGDGKVYGRQNKDGSVTLYVSDKKATLFDRLTMRAGTRRNVARQEIGRLLGDMKASHQGKNLGQDARNVSNTVFDRITGQVVARESRALRAADVIKLARSAMVISNVLDDKAVAPEKASFDIDEALAAAPGNGRTLSNLPARNYTDMFGKPLSAPAINIGGKDYTPTRYITSGGFGHVCAYEAADGSKLAVKLGNPPNPNSDFAEDDPTAEAAAEIALHVKATAGNVPNLMKMQGAFRMDDGRVGIALDFAPNGTAYDAGHAVTDAIASDPRQVGAGEITRAEADIVRLTMVRDMAEGLKQLHGNDVTHYDFKGPNCLVDAQGVVKIADFGASFVGKEGAQSTLTDIGNPHWRAPEYKMAVETRSKIEERPSVFANNVSNVMPSPIEEMQAATKKDVVSVLREIFPNQQDSNYSGAASNILANRFANLNVDAQQVGRIDNSADVWGLGTSALDLFSRDREEKAGIEAFGNAHVWGRNENNRALGVRDASGALPADALDEATGTAEVDDLINKLLAPNPDKRAKFFRDEMSGHPAMAIRGVGSPEARALTVAVLSGDATAIANARAALAAATR